MLYSTITLIIFSFAYFNIIATNAINIVTGIITTIAGTGGSAGFSGDGGLASSARLNSPSGVFVDILGDMYICDSNNHAIRKIDVDGIITTVAGTGGSSGYSGDGGTASNARLYYPSDVYVDTSRNIYIPDHWNHVFRKVDASGVITTIAGIGGSPGFSGDGGLATNARLHYPAGAFVDASGNVYISDAGNNVIRKIDVNGVITTIAGIGGSAGFSGDGGLATNARLNYPYGVFGDTSGNIYISDYGNHAIRKVDVSGVITTIAGTGGSPGFSGDGGFATNARLNYPLRVIVDSSRNIYISDQWNHVFRKVDASGVITTIAGIGGSPGFSGDGGLATSAQLYYPAGAFVDTSGNVYISDAVNNAIRKVTLPTAEPTAIPTLEPTYAKPTLLPTNTAKPTRRPTVKPSFKPTLRPSKRPTEAPSPQPRTKAPKTDKPTRKSKA
jgi:hypothetical protein